MRIWLICYFVKCQKPGPERSWHTLLRRNITFRSRTDLIRESGRYGQISEAAVGEKAFLPDL